MRIEHHMQLRAKQKHSTGAYRTVNRINMDRPDPFRWLQGTAARAVILTDTYTNLVHENTVRIAIALNASFLGTISYITKSHKMGYA